MKKIVSLLLILLITLEVNAQNASSNAQKIEDLEKQKSIAVEKQDWALANKLKTQIEKLENPSSNPNAAKIEALEKQKNIAAENHDWALANKLKTQIEKLENPSANPNAAKIEALEKQKNIAAENHDWALANKLKAQIEKLENPSSNPNAAKIEALEKQKNIATENHDWALANNIKKQIEQLENPMANLKKGSNLRETSFLNMDNQDFATTNSFNQSTTNTTNINGDYTKVKSSDDNSLAKDLKYRRSSLYTLMVNDPARPHANVIKDAFGNALISGKFNDHNIGPYIIEGYGNSPDRSYEISNYLNTNHVAREMVAKWFNRTHQGEFNMELIKERGEYDASAYDKLIASSSARGNALLEDAGEDLIGNTFVIVNDFKFTNKEEIANKTKIATSALRTGLSFIPGAGALSSAVNTVTKITDVGLTVAGKGYIIKTTSYLYRLVWNDSVAAVFYNNMWADANSLDQTKVQNFTVSNLFTLRYVGNQDAIADVQSSIFTNKSEEDLIRMATVKATDKAIAKLERKYEEFRTKTPLNSVEPLTAKIGLKEDLEPGDKFEVLESAIDLNGKIQYKRKGIITVQSGMIWDNTYVPEELKGSAPIQPIDATYFNGPSGIFYPGMLIKQIN